MSFDTQKEQGDRARVGKRLKQREHQRSVRQETVPAAGMALYRLRNRRFDRLANKSIRKAAVDSTPNEYTVSIKPTAAPSRAFSFVLSTRSIIRIVQAEATATGTGLGHTALPTAPLTSSTPTNWPTLPNPLASMGWGYTSRDAYNGCRSVLEWSQARHQQQQEQQQQVNKARARLPRSDVQRSLQIAQQVAIVKRICHEVESHKPLTADHQQHLVMQACRVLGKLDGRTAASRAQPGASAAPKKSLRPLADEGLDYSDDYEDIDEAEEEEEEEEEEEGLQQQGEPGYKANSCWHAAQPLPAASPASDDSESEEFIFIELPEGPGDAELPALLTAAADHEERCLLEAEQKHMLAQAQVQVQVQVPTGPIVLDLQQLLLHSKRTSKRKGPAHAGQQQQWQQVPKQRDEQQEQQHEEWPSLRPRPEEDAFVMV